MQLQMFRTCRRASARGGFTLIELLVVISIIALLISILLPAIGAARDTAKAANCQSNMRQIGVAQMNYATEYNEKLSGTNRFATSWAAAENHVLWVNGFHAHGNPSWGNIYHPMGHYLWPYIGENAEVFFEPGHPNSERKGPGSSLVNEYLSHGFSQSEAERLAAATSTMFSGSYIPMSEGGGGVWDTGIRLGSYDLRAHGKNARLTDEVLRRASETVIVREGGGSDVTFSIALPPADAGTTHSSQYVPAAHVDNSHFTPDDSRWIDAVHGRHPGYATNMLFGDGHVEARNAKEMRAQINSGDLDPVLAGATRYK